MHKIVVVGDTTIDKNQFGDFGSCTASDSGRAFRSELSEHQIGLGAAGNVQRMLATKPHSEICFIMPSCSEDPSYRFFGFIPVLEPLSFDWKIRFWDRGQVAFRWDVRGSGIAVPDARLKMDCAVKDFIRSASIIVVSDYGKGFCRNLGDGFWKLVNPTALILYEGKYSADFCQGFNAIQKVCYEDFTGSPKKRLLEADNTSGLIVTSSGGPVSVFSKDPRSSRPDGLSTDFHEASPLDGFPTNGAGDRFLAMLAAFFSQNYVPGSPVRTLDLVRACSFADKACRNYHAACKRSSIQPYDFFTPIPSELAGQSVYTTRDLNWFLESRFLKKKIAVTSGCFDVLHQGHLKLLEEARQFGPLFVFVNDDASVASLKGSNRPVRGLASRIETLSRLPFVTGVIPFSGPSPVQAYSDSGLVGCHCVLFKGRKDKARVPEDEAAFFNQVRFIESGPHSTTAILEGIR